jgi:hypothetical protein
MMSSILVLIIWPFWGITWHWILYAHPHNDHRASQYILSAIQGPLRMLS